MNSSMGHQAEGDGPSSGDVFPPSLEEQCDAAIREFCQGERANAKQTLQRLMKEFPNEHLPARYLARLLYHEAAVMESQEHGTRLSEPRLQLLKQALQMARKATELNPLSLSSAALRATLVVNVLVEESSLFSAPAGSAQDIKCQQIKKEFASAMAACRAAANVQQPLLREPTILIADGVSQTCDPCSLRVQEHIDVWVKEGRWDLVVKEKRNVLVCMQQVLQSCHTLLDSTQIPVDGVVRLLQHILRSLLPHRPPQDLQTWASQLLLGASQGCTGSASTSQGSAEAAALPPVPQQPVNHHHQQAAAPLAAPVQQHPQQALPPPTMQQPAANPGALNQQAAAAPSNMALAPVQNPTQSLSMERDWDWDKDASGAAGSNSNAAGGAPANARRRGKGKQNARAAVGPSRKERTQYERYTDVEVFWRSLRPEQRRELLRVPLAPLLQSVRQEHGQEVVEEACEGLVLLHEQGNRAARYWTCPTCDQKFPSARDYLAHVEVAHEEVAMQGGKYVMCTKCQVEVVGMYWTSTRVPDYNLCARCYMAEAPTMPDAETFERIYPRAPSLGGPRHWSDTGSDFVSTRDSFTSMEEADRYDGVATPPPCLPAYEASSEWASPMDQLCVPASEQLGHAGGASMHGSPMHGGGMAMRQLHSRYGNSPLRPPHAASPSPPLSRSNSIRSTSSTRSAAGAARLMAAAAPDALRPPTPPLHQQQRPGAADGGGSWRSSSDGAPGDMLHPDDEDDVDDVAAADDADAAGGSGSLLKSWWPRRLLQSWGSERRRSSDAQLQQVPPPQHAPAPHAHPHPHHPYHPHPHQMQQQQNPGGRYQDAAHNGQQSEGNSSSWSSGAGSAPAQRAAAATAAAGGAAPGAGPHQRSAAGSGPPPAGGRGDAEFSGEVREVMAVVEEVMHRMREMYGADRQIGDMALGSVMQFVYRKLGAVLDEVAPVEEAPVVRQYLREFMARPACVFQKPDVLRAVLGCLPIGDLQMVLAYVVRQHADALAQAADGGSDVCSSSEDLDGAGDQGEEEEGEGSGCLEGDDAALGAAGPGTVGQQRGPPTQSHPQPHPHAQPAQQQWSAGGPRAHERQQLQQRGAAAPHHPGQQQQQQQLVPYDGDQQHQQQHHHRQAAGQQQVAASEGDAAGDGGLDPLEAEMAVPPLFQLVTPDVTSLHNLVAEVWARDEEAASLQADDLTHHYADGHAQQQQHRGKGARGREGDSQAHGHGQQQHQHDAAGEDPQQQLLAGVRMEGGAIVSSPLSAPCLSVAPWWLDHLAYRAREEGEVASAPGGGKGSGNGAGELPLLRWVYGKIVHAQAEELCARQREVRSGRDRDAVVSDLYEDLAYVWRSLQAVLDQRARLEELRKSARAQFALVKQLEDEGQHCSVEEAAEFLEALMAHHYAQQQAQQQQQQQAAQAQLDQQQPEQGQGQGEEGAVAAPPPLPPPPPPPPQPTQASLFKCEAAVDVVRRYPSLAQEASQRYGRALLDRELAVLFLAEAMLVSDAEEAGRERQSCEEALRKHRQEHKEVEAERQRVEAEGPASHRKKDLLDKKTKEAEHKERLQDLNSRLSSLKDAISEDESAVAKWGERAAEAEADVKYVREQLRLVATRKKHLDELCAQLELPPPPAVAALQQLMPEAVAAAAADDCAGVPAGAGGAAAAAAAAAHAAAAAEREWQEARLDTLMMRVMRVCEAVKLYQDVYTPHSGGRHYELFLKATSWARALGEEYEEQIKGWYGELDKLRAKLLDAACVDMGHVLSQHALELVRRRIEAAARLAREQAFLTALREVEQEAAASKQGEGSKSGASANGGGGGGGGGKASKKQKLADKQREKREREEAEKAARAAEAEARKAAEEVERQRLAAARQAREAALEAELERRRKELEELETVREAEAIRAAQEASLKEQERQQQRQQAAAAAPAPSAAAAAPAASPKQQQATAAGPKPAAAAAPPAPQQQQAAGKGTAVAAAATGKKGAATAAQQQAQQQQSAPPSPDKTTQQQQQQQKRTPTKRGAAAAAGDAPGEQAAKQQHLQAQQQAQQHKPAGGKGREKTAPTTPTKSGKSAAAAAAAATQDAGGKGSRGAVIDNPASAAAAAAAAAAVALATASVGAKGARHATGAKPTAAAALAAARPVVSKSQPASPPQPAAAAAAAGVSAAGQQQQHQQQGAAASWRAVVAEDEAGRGQQQLLLPLQRPSSAPPDAALLLQQQQLPSMPYSPGHAFPALTPAMAAHHQQHLHQQYLAASKGLAPAGPQQQLLHPAAGQLPLSSLGMDQQQRAFAQQQQQQQHLRMASLGAHMGHGATAAAGLTPLGFGPLVGDTVSGPLLRPSLSFGSINHVSTGLSAPGSLVGLSAADAAAAAAAVASPAHRSAEGAADAGGMMLGASGFGLGLHTLPNIAVGLPHGALPPAAAGSPLFDPLRSENPLLRALLPDHQPMLPVSGAPGGGAPAPPAAGQQQPRSPLNSGISSGPTTPTMVSSPRSDPASLSSPAAPAAAAAAAAAATSAAPEADHIMSIMSILEPENGRGQAPNAAQQRSGSTGAAAGTASSAAALGLMSHPSLDASSLSPLVTAASIPGGYSIWSTSGAADSKGGASGWGASTAAAAAAMAASGAGPVAPRPAAAGGSGASGGSNAAKAAGSGLSSAAAPYVPAALRAQQHQAAPSVADIAASLPASLLPASLDPDVTLPAARQQLQQQPGSATAAAAAAAAAAAGASPARPGAAGQQQHLPGGGFMRGGVAAGAAGAPLRGSTSMAIGGMGPGGMAVPPGGIRPWVPGQLLTAAGGQQPAGGLLLPQQHPELMAQASGMVSAGRYALPASLFGPDTVAAPAAATAGWGATVGTGAQAGMLQGLVGGAAAAGGLAAAGSRATNSTWAPFVGGAGNGGGAGGGAAPAAGLGWPRSGR